MPRLARFTLLGLVFFSLLSALFGVYPAPPAVALGPARGPVFSPLLTVNAWSALGSGLNNNVNALAINGSDIYVGGLFTNAGGDPNADRIAKWDGSSWSALGSGIGNGVVNSLTFNGSNLYVGGSFTDAGGNTSADFIAQWDGSSWSTLGNGLGNEVKAVAVNGSNIYVGGLFTNAGGDPNADFIAKLDGSTWEALGASPLNNLVNAIVVAGPTVYAGGNFTGRVAMWDGSTWTTLGGGLNNPVFALALVGSDLYVGGAFTNVGGNANADLIAKWDGSSWSALGSGLANTSVSTIFASGSNLYVGGAFDDAGGDANADNIARWDGSSWSALGVTPLNSAVLEIYINGLDLYAGGSFTDAGGDSNADKIAKFEIDATAPTVNSFTATSPSSLDVPITAFTASDNAAVTGYKITESSTPPAASAAGWTASAPSTYTVASGGSYTLYPWVKDATGNVSAVYGSPATVSVDANAPTVTAFSAPSSVTSLTVSITSFTASDNVGVTGYKITESSTPPAAGAAGWTASAPTSYTFSSYGNHSLYPWAKDAVGNVSAVYGSPASVSNCGNTITITSTADSGAGTLRQAIPDLCTGGTINFDSSLSGGTIRLASTLTLSKSVTIDGSSLASKITISGDSDNNGTGDVRVLYIDTSGVKVTLESLIIAKGKSSGNEGGGLLITSDTTTTITNTTFSGNSAFVGGGLSNYGTLTIGNSTFSGNSTTAGGGGLYNNSVLTITHSTFSNNSAPGSGLGGGLVNGGPALIANSTFSGNSAAQGGGIYTTEPLTITNSTLSGNSATTSGGGLLTAGTTNLANTIIANSASGGDCSNSGTLGTNTNNLVEDGSCSPALSGDPNLDSLADNGGPTQTFALLTGSSAIEAGDDTTCAASPVNNLDQRGVARPNSAHCDIGAYEYEDTTAPSVTAFTATSPSTSLNIPITTFTASDSIGVTGYKITTSSTAPGAGDSGWTGSAPTSYTASNYGNYTLYPWAKDAAGNVSSVFGSPASVFVCSSGPITVTSITDSGAGTLRQAISDLCAGGTINFDSSLSGGTIYLASTLTLSRTLTIDGSSLASKITLSGDSDSDGDGDVRPFITSNSPTVTLNSLIITKGLASGGGAINNAIGTTLTITNSTLISNSANFAGGIVNGGTLTITNSTFSGNTATTSNAGAIYNSGGMLTISGSTFSGNTAATATTGGGAIYNNGTATVTNSTFSGNAATTNNGGAIYNSTNTLTIRNSTFSGNAAANSGGGIYIASGTFNYANTIIANSIGGDCSNSGTLGTNTNNLVEDGFCSASLSGDPGLDSLKDNGGSTQTMALTLASTAVNAGDDTTCAASPVNNLDQRGVTRPVGTHCDIGAYEGAVDVTAPIVISFAATSPSNSLNIPITTFTASDDDAIAAYLINTASTQPASSDPGWTGSVSYTAAGDGTYTLYPWVKDYAGNVSSVFGSPVTVTVDATAPTVVMSSTTANPTLTSPIPVTATFSESVSNFTVSDITVSNAVVGNFAGSGSTYTFELTPSGPGLVTADIAANVAQDSVGNLNTAATQFSRTYLAPEIALLGNSLVINTGDVSPSVSDGTNFGSATLGGVITHTFTISNSGNTNLTLSGSPVITLTGSAADDFSVVATPTSPVGANLTTTFKIRFKPTALGTRTVTVSIANTDANENPYTFAISGTVSNVMVYLSIILR